MMKPHRIFDGTFDYGDIHAHLMRIDGGETGNRASLGHAHEYPHMMDLKRTDPPGAAVDVFAVVDGKEIVVPMTVDETWYIKERVRHTVIVPPGVTAWVRCIFSKFGPDGPRFDPKVEWRGPQTEKEPWNA